MPIRNISQAFIEEVQDTARGTLPTADNSSIGTDLVAWTKMKKLLDEGVAGGKLFSGEMVSTYSLVYTGSGGIFPYFGGVLAPNGDIHFVPRSAPVGQKISASGVVSTYSLVYTTIDSYYGGVLAPNGDIHFVPRSAPVGQKYLLLASYLHIHWFILLLLLILEVY